MKIKRKMDLFPFLGRKWNFLSDAGLHSHNYMAWQLADKERRQGKMMEWFPVSGLVVAWHVRIPSFSICQVLFLGGLVQACS